MMMRSAQNSTALLVARWSSAIRHISNTGHRPLNAKNMTTVPVVQVVADGKTSATGAGLEAREETTVTNVITGVITAARTVQEWVGIFVTTGITAMGKTGTSPSKKGLNRCIPVHKNKLPRIVKPGAVAVYKFRGNQIMA